MARPNKPGIDYFPLDIRFLRDTKTKYIKAEFGAKGIVVLINVLSQIYEEEGYFMKWNDDICLLMSADIGCDITANLTSEIVQGCIKRSFFDEGVFNMFGVLTSPAIQRRYLRAVSTRDIVNILEEYFLLDIDNEDDVPKGIRKKIAFKNVSLQRNEVNLQRNEVNLQYNTQSKEKKSKGKERKENKKEDVVYFPDELLNKTTSDFIAFRKEIKSPMTERAIELLVEKLNKLSNDNDEKIEILKQSITNGWKGIFPLNNTKNNNNNFQQDMKEWVDEHEYRGI